jgi:SlyX protein
MPDRTDLPDPPDRDDERWLDVDVKLAYQERLIRELDTLVREFGSRLDKAERLLEQLKQAMPSPLPLGAANEPPPHY